MRFRVRNLFYLRLSASDVVPLYIYLDERHVDWMSERTLHAVVEDLRPLVGPKLQDERNAHYGPGGPANAKKGTVEVHRGDTYQFAYFLRKAGPHAIVVKTRNYVMANHPSEQEVAPPKQTQEDTMSTTTAQPSKGTKRPRKKTVQVRSANRKGKGKARASDIIEIESSEEEIEESSLSETDDETDVEMRTVVPRRSSRRKKQRKSYREVSDEDGNTGGEGIISEGDMQIDEEEDVQIKQETVDDDSAFREGDLGMPSPAPPLPPNLGIDEDEEQKKLKPELQLSFRNLRMQDRCLCVVVEPWPALPSRPTPFLDEKGGMCEPSVAPIATERGLEQAPSVAPSHFRMGAEAETGRERTPLPLFLPDPSGRDHSVTPAPTRFPGDFSNLETIEDTQEVMEEDDGFGMLAFSQVLNNVSGDRIGTTEDDDEMDEGALYGDADEKRGTIQ